MPNSCEENFPDDPAIENDADLLRRIPSYHFFQDNNSGLIRPSSAAFEDDEDGEPMSVYLATVLEEARREEDCLLAGHSGYALAAITAGMAREKNQTVHPDPQPEEKSHAVVCGDKRSGGQKCPKKTLAKGARWVIAPPRDFGK